MGRKLKLSALVLCLAMLTPMLLAALPSMIPAIDESGLASVLPSVEVARAQSDNWWNLNWKYRRKITITNNVNYELTNYQVNITINTQNLISQGKLKNDADDLRFVTANGQLLHYWIETPRDKLGSTTQAIVWVKVPSIPAGGSVDIYMYYGCDGASDASSGWSTFEAYESFESYTQDQDLPSDFWEYVYGETYWEVKHVDDAPDIYDSHDGDNVQNVTVTGVANATILYRDFSGENYTVRVLVSFDDDGDTNLNATIVGRFNWLVKPTKYNSYLVGINGTTVDCALCICKNFSSDASSPAQCTLLEATTLSQALSEFTEYWLEAKFLTLSDGSVKIIARFWEYGSDISSAVVASTTDTSSPLTSGGAGLQGSYDSGDTDFFDLFFIRKAALYEPSVSVSATEETAPFFELTNLGPKYLKPSTSTTIYFKVVNRHPSEDILHINITWPYSEIHGTGVDWVTPSSGTYESISPHGYKLYGFSTPIGPNGGVCQFGIKVDIGSLPHGSYTLTVACKTAGTSGMTHSEETTILIDTNPPPAPSTPTATSYPGVIQVTWPAVVETDPNESPIVGYVIERNDSQTFEISTTATGTIVFNDYWGTDGKTYVYHVAAKDAAGNVGTYSSWSNPATFTTERPIISYSIQLNPGWNLISIPVVLEEAKNITSMLLGQPYDTSTDPIAGPSGLYWADTGDALTWNEIEDNVEVVYAYYYNSSHPHPTTGEYKWWRGYTPGATDSDLMWMRDGYGYFIKLPDTLPHPINFTVYGYRTIGAPATMPSYYLTVDDTEGHDPWNLIGFTSIVEMVYTEYLDSLGDAYADDLVIYWDGVQYKRLTAGQNMEPGMGYWVLMLEDAYLTPPPPS